MSIEGQSIRVFIADDHTVAREGLRAMLENAPHVDVVGEAADGELTLKKVDELDPDIVLMDIRMPGIDGLETTRRLKSAHPTIQVIVMTNYDDDALVIDAMLAGADGYLLKDVSRELLSHTIATVANGGNVVFASLIQRAMKSVLATGRMPAPTTRAPAQAGKLTERELSVLKLMAEGRTNKEIGDVLALAEVTVKKHVQSIIAKLCASDRTQAAILGLRMGLIE